MTYEEAFAFLFQDAHNKDRGGEDPAQDGKRFEAILTIVKRGFDDLHKIEGHLHEIADQVGKRP